MTSIKKRRSTFGHLLSLCDIRSTLKHFYLCDLCFSSKKMPLLLQYKMFLFTATYKHFRDDIHALRFDKHQKFDLGTINILMLVAYL